MSREITKRRNGNGRALTIGAHGEEAVTDKDQLPALDFGHAWDYAPAPESPDHVKIQPKYELFIDGR